MKRIILSVGSLLAVFGMFLTFGVIYATPAVPSVPTSCGPESTIASGSYTQESITITMGLCPENPQSRFIKQRIANPVTVTVIVSPKPGSSLDLVLVYYDRSSNPLGAQGTDITGPGGTETMTVTMLPGYHAFEITPKVPMAGEFTVQVIYPEGYKGPQAPMLNPNAPVQSSYAVNQTHRFEFTSSAPISAYIVVTSATMGYNNNPVTVDFEATYHKLGPQKLTVTTYAEPLPNSQAQFAMPINEFQQEFFIGKPVFAPLITK